MPATVLGAGIAVASETNKQDSCPHGAYSLVGETRNNIRKSHRLLEGGKCQGEK